MITIPPLFLLNLMQNSPTFAYYKKHNEIRDYYCSGDLNNK